MGRAEGEALQMDLRGTMEGTCPLFQGAQAPGPGHRCPVDPVVGAQAARVQRVDLQHVVDAAGVRLQHRRVELGQLAVGELLRLVFVQGSDPGHWHAI